MSTLVGLVAGLSPACDDEAVTVRVRDGGTSATDASSGTNLACGVAIPSAYVSPLYTTNAKEELDLRAHAFEIDRKMAATEGSSSAILTSTELDTAFKAGAPNLRSVSTAATQSTIDGYLVAYGDAVGRKWTPEQAAADGGAAAGGKYDAAYHVSATGLDLRSATARTLLGGTFYNHAVSLASGAVTEATIDRLLAVYGATPAFVNRTDADAGADRDDLTAELASQRDDDSQSTPGPYRRIRSALISAKAAAAGGDGCKADLSASLAVFFAEWEKVIYASVIYALNLSAVDASAQPAKGAAALRGFGDAVGLIQSFRGVAQDRRKITDVQIDTLLAKIGADKPYETITLGADHVASFTGAIQDIAGIYGFSQDDVEAFKKVF